MKMRPSINDSGFSLLEALVALALLSTAFVVLMEMQIQNAFVLTSVEGRIERLEVKKAAIEHLRVVDLEGGSPVIELGAGWQVEWEIEPITPEVSALYGIGQRSRYGVMLVRLKGYVQKAPQKQFEVEVVRLRFM